MPGQALRPSQFVYTFGVGSIIEAPGGPRLVLDFDKWGQVFGPGRTPSVYDFVIRDSTMSAVLEDGQIFRIPTNVDLGEPESKEIFSTGRFPEWALCVRHEYLFQLSSDDRTRCPDCISAGSHHSARPEAIRFVRACPDGHMDDVDWFGIVHSGKQPCSNTVYTWKSEGGALRDVEIACSSCGAKKTLLDVYKETKHCRGRYPEKGTAFSSCAKEAKVTLRGSSSLRIPEIVATITIPRFASPLHRVLDDFQMRTVLATRPSWTKADLLAALQSMSSIDPSLVDPRTVDELTSVSENRLLKVIEDLRRFGHNRPTTIQDIREMEFNALQDAAENGHPPDPTSENPEFQVNKWKVRSDVNFHSQRYRIAPVERLRVVTVQKGYRRLGTDPNSNRFVNTFYFDGHKRWFPGLEQIGEGIFIDLGKDKLDTPSNDWDAEYSKHAELQYHPAFVWWHSFAHRIITALSIDSGYSSAAIRESVYLVRDPKSGEFSGGVLLYTTQTGTDGSLGGLISLVPDFETVLEAAVRNLDSCSNDPLCGETSVRTRGNNGAACYACMLLSETSCSNRNMFLDRNLLRSCI